jgi:D-alanine-D-alanine ligase
MKINKHIQIVSSAASGFGSMSSPSREAIYAILAKHYTRVGITMVNSLSDLEALAAARPDLVFLGAHCAPRNPSLGLLDSNRIWLSQYLTEQGIAHTGSSSAAHQLEHNKQLAKQRVLDSGLMTSPYYVAGYAQPPIKDGTMSLNFPLFVKPTDRGGGAGIDCDSVARNIDELSAKVESIATQLQSAALVEEYLPGREFSVAILKDEHSAEYVAMPIELVAEPDQRGSRMLSAEVKSADTEKVLEVTDQAMRAKVCTLAMSVFTALGAQDYGRIDIRMDKSGTPHFLEANLIPSLIKNYGSFPKACLLNQNLDHEPMILTITRLALTRLQTTYHHLPEPLSLINAILPNLEPALKM